MIDPKPWPKGKTVYVSTLSAFRITPLVQVRKGNGDLLKEHSGVLTAMETRRFALDVSFEYDAVVRRRAWASSPSTFHNTVYIRGRRGGVSKLHNPDWVRCSGGCNQDFLRRDLKWGTNACWGGVCPMCAENPDPGQDF